MDITLALVVIVATSIIIYFASSRFAEHSSKIGDHFHMPRSVKGATLDAVSSSLPELLVALFSVVIFREFEVGIGTIAGSALFNLLVIPGICVFVAPVAFRVSKKVISRDALFYLMSVFLLLVLLLYFRVWGIFVAFLLLVGYLLYIKVIVSHTREYRKKGEKTVVDETNLKKELTYVLFTMTIIAVATFFLTDASIDLSHMLGISPIIIAFTITAAATSAPDAVISIVNARKGDIDDAAANVFGSNIFDILVGIGLPLLIYFIAKGALEIAFTNLEIVLGLLGSTIIILYFFAEAHTLNRKQAAFLLLMYLFFLIYVVSLSF